MPLDECLQIPILESLTEPDFLPFLSEFRGHCPFIHDMFKEIAFESRRRERDAIVASAMGGAVERV
jgi:hypothetical protein